MIRALPRKAKGKIEIINEKGLVITSSLSVVEPGEIVIIQGRPGTVQRVDDANVYIEFPDEVQEAEIRKMTEIFEIVSEITRVHEIDEKDVNVFLGILV